MARKQKGPLPDFEGTMVSRSEVKITRAGDGLSEALKVAPVALHHGDRVFFVMEGIVSQVNHKPIGPDETILTRVHTVVAERIALVGEADLTDVETILDENLNRVRLAAEEAAGISRLPGVDDPIGEDGF